MTNHAKSALEIEQQILGESRRLMPCGCVMYISPKGLEGPNGPTYWFAYPVCDAHEERGNPHVGAMVPND